MEEVAGTGLTVADFLAESPLGRRVYDGVSRLVDELGPATVRVTKSQVAFRSRKAFCWLWLPGMYLARPGAEVVVSLALGREDTSPRWKETVQVTPHRWMHHLEVHDVADLDAQLQGWLAEAYELAT